MKIVWIITLTHFAAVNNFNAEVRRHDSSPAGKRRALGDLGNKQWASGATNNGFILRSVS